MLQTFSSSINPVLEQKFLNAIISYFVNENDKLGLELDKPKINTICRILLYGNEPNSDKFRDELVNEETLLDEYHKKEFEIIDHLHLVSLELRKQLGQYSTPVSIIKYILKSVGYTPSKDILSKKLIDPACGSGAFLVAACRVYLHVLKKASIPISEWYPMVIMAIHGIDIDPTACFQRKSFLITLKTTF